MKSLIVEADPNQVKLTIGVVKAITAVCALTNGETRDQVLAELTATLRWLNNPLYTIDPQSIMDPPP